MYLHKIYLRCVKERFKSKAKCVFTTNAEEQYGYESRSIDVDDSCVGISGKKALHVLIFI